MTAFALLRGLWLFVALVWLISVVKLDVLDEVHHFWWGLLVTLVALPLPWDVVRLVLAYLGLLIASDDAWQHAYQWLAGDPEYRSPLHALYRRLYWRLPKRGRL